MRVSVAMATFNGSRFIRKQLESLSSQTVLPFELVVTDDGSSDSTGEIIREFGATSPFPVRLHENETRLGFADNFFAAARLCRGDAIALCDQDDVWLPDKLDRVTTDLQRPGVVCVIHRGLVVDQDLQPRGMLVPAISKDSLAPPLSGDPWFEPDGFCMAFSRSILAFDTRRRPPSRWPAPQMLHDEWVHFISHACGITSYVREALVLHRQHGDNSSGPRDSLEDQTALNLLAKARERGRPQTAEWYDLLARRAASRREYLLEEAGRFPATSPLRERLAQATAYYEIVERRWERRSQLYSVTRGRPIHFGALVRAGAYRSRSRGGFGARAFVRDGLSLLGAV
jgi:glycosyltransferase involved in cell wall biosynthesis